MMEEYDTVTITPVHGMVTADVQKLATQIRAYIERSLSPALKVDELVCDFTKDATGQWCVRQGAGYWQGVAAALRPAGRCTGGCCK